MSEMDPALNNPWQVSHFDEFLYYCCPECIYRSQDLGNFEEHANNIHMIDIHKEQLKQDPFMINIKKDLDVEIKQEYFEDEVQNGSIVVENSEENHFVDSEDTKPFDINQEIPNEKDSKSIEPTKNIEKKFCCDICKKLLSSSTHLKNHRTQVHKVEHIYSRNRSKEYKYNCLLYTSPSPRD